MLSTGLHFASESTETVRKLLALTALRTCAAAEGAFWPFSASEYRQR